MPLLLFDDPDESDSLIAVADAQSELVDVGVLVCVVASMLALAVVVDDNVDVENALLVAVVLTEEVGGSSLLILKYADETSLYAVLP